MEEIPITTKEGMLLLVKACTILAAEMINVVVELVEHMIHYILYVRQIYPEVSFERTTLYSVPLWRCTHKTVCAYIKEIIDALRPLMHKVPL